MRYLPFVQTAIAELGLIKPEFDTAIAIVMEAFEGQHPRDISTEYRKIGDQISDVEKRTLGLRKNMFFSREALESLTEKGRERLKDAHMTTMLHAGLGYFHMKAIEDAKRFGYSEFKIFAVFKDCPGCRELGGEIIGLNHAANLRPNSCAREVCTLALMPYKDFLAGIE